MRDSAVGLRLRAIAHILLFLFIFLFLPILSTLKICHSFLGIIEATIFKLGVHMENELLYCGTDKRANCSYFPFSHLSIFLSFSDRLVSQFYQGTRISKHCMYGK